MRLDGRKNDELRPVKIIPSYLKFAEGSCLIEIGDTKVLCAASVENKVPPFLIGSSSGWITAEYSMLPRSTQTRTTREITRGKIDGRSQEIQRLIGRALRSVVNLKILGERTIWVDCDVIQADGGTRCAAITGAYVATSQALAYLQDNGEIKEWPVKDLLAAVSVGIVGGEELLDLNFYEDSQAEVDMNLAMTASSKIVEIQATAEHRPFTFEDLIHLIEFGKKGVQELFKIQKEVLSILDKKL